MIRREKKHGLAVEKHKKWLGKNYTKTRFIHENGCDFLWNSMFRKNAGKLEIWIFGIKERRGGAGNSLIWKWKSDKERCRESGFHEISGEIIEPTEWGAEIGDGGVWKIEIRVFRNIGIFFYDKSENWNFRLKSRKNEHLKFTVSGNYFWKFKSKNRLSTR